MKRSRSVLLGVPTGFEAGLLLAGVTAIASPIVLAFAMNKYRFHSVIGGCLPDISVTAPIDPTSKLSVDQDDDASVEQEQARISMAWEELVNQGIVSPESICK